MISFDNPQFCTYAISLWVRDANGNGIRKISCESNSADEICGFFQKHGGSYYRKSKKKTDKKIENN